VIFGNVLGPDLLHRLDLLAHLGGTGLVYGAAIFHLFGIQSPGTIAAIANPNPMMQTRTIASLPRSERFLRPDESLLGVIDSSLSIPRAG
jgi:hypothetical protein